MSRFGATAAATIFGLTSGGNLPASHSDKEALLANSLLPFGTSIRRNIGASWKNQEMFLASNGIEFGTPPDAQSKTKAIPAIDFNNLPYQQQVKKMADGWRAKYHLPGVWCAYIKDGKVVACVASGVKNVETGAKADINDYLPLASASKPVTGSMIAFFVAKGIIRYETTFGEVFPELTQKYRNSPLLRSSLRQFMAHTSGVPNETNLKIKNTTSYANKMETLEAVAKSSLLIDPGSKYIYSSLNAVIATAMVEKLSGTNCESWLKGEIGKDIGIYDPKSLSDSLPIARYYLDLNRRSATVLNENPKWSFNPAGGYALTLEDLCGFALFSMYNSPQIPESIYNDLHSRVNESLRSDTSASWHVASNGYLFHDGGLPGLFMSVRVDPRSKCAFIWGTNSNVQPGSSIDTIGALEDIKQDIFKILKN